MKKLLTLVILALVVGAALGLSGQMVGACNVFTQSPNPC
jgi:ABC-type enterobactin transport system permease subunit